MSKKEMNLYKRCKNIFKSHGVDMGGGGGSSGGGMSYDVIVTSLDGGQTCTITHGTYADLKTKIDAHDPAHMLLFMDITDGGATAKYQVPAMYVAMETTGKISGLIYIPGSPAPVGLFILPDGTAEVRV